MTAETGLNAGSFSDLAAPPERRRSFSICVEASTGFRPGGRDTEGPVGRVLGHLFESAMYRLPVVLFVGRARRGLGVLTLWYTCDDARMARGANTGRQDHR